MYVCVRSANHSSLINPPSVTPVLDGCLSHKLSPQVWSQQGIRHTSRQGGPQWRSAQWHALARSRLFCQQLLSQLFIIVPAASSCHQGSEITRPRIWIWLRSAQWLWGCNAHPDLCPQQPRSIKINQDTGRIGKDERKPPSPRGAEAPLMISKGCRPSMACEGRQTCCSSRCLTKSFCRVETCRITAAPWTLLRIGVPVKPAKTVPLAPDSKLPQIGVTRWRNDRVPNGNHHYLFLESPMKWDI